MSLCKVQNTTVLSLQGTEPIFNTITISTVSALSCSSSSEARPSMPRQEIRLRITKAVVFCKEFQMEPTDYRLAKLTGFTGRNRAKLWNYFNGKDEIVRTIFSLDPQLATPYSVICRRQLGVLTNLTYNWTGSNFTSMEIINGLNGYSLFSIPVDVKMVEFTKLNPVQESFVAIAAQLLKEMGYIHSMTGSISAYHLASSVIKLLWATTLKGGKVTHSHQSLRYLNHYDKNQVILHKSKDHKCNGLFYRSDRNGNTLTGSYKYFLSRRGETFMRLLIERFTSLSLGSSVTPVGEADLIVPRSVIFDDEMHQRDQVMLLSRCAGIIDGRLHIVNSITDNQDSRVYGLATMLTAPCRASIWKYGVDIAAALQSIVFDVLDKIPGYDAAKEFPLHLEMATDRKALRNRICEETGKDMSWAKTKLTSVDNGGSVSKKILALSPSLKAYYEEARPFVERYMEHEDKEILMTAKKHSKRHDLNDEFIRERVGTVYNDQGYKIFSLFFFCWTQRERVLREIAKKHCKGYSHDVHDAVASKEVIDVEAVNSELVSAGFKYSKFEVA